jgi:hypothetical protein
MKYRFPKNPPFNVRVLRSLQGYFKANHRKPIDPAEARRMPDGPMVGRTP